MTIDIPLQNLGDDAPSGEDLEYDPLFMELEIAGQPGEERQAGDEIIAAEEPDYKEVSAKALEVLERSHDLRAAVFLAEAQIRLNGFPGFAKVTNYIASCLDEYWATCHPQLDEDDDDDPTMRVNAILSLADPSRIVGGVRRAPLTESRMFGALSLRHMEVADGEIAAPRDMDNVPDAGAVAAAFQDTDEDRLREISEAAASSLADVRAISAKFDDATPGMGPDLDPLIKVLGQANTRLANALGDPVEETTEETDAEGGDSPARPTGGGGGGTGAINNPNDVQNALDRIIAYYERFEPSSPMPLLLQRAKTLVNADFLTIVKALAPGGLENVNLVGGIEEEEDY